MIYALPIGRVSLSWPHSQWVLHSPAAQRACRPVRIVTSTETSWTWPWRKGFRRTWWGKVRRTKRETFNPSMRITGIEVGQQLLCGELPVEMFGAASFDARLIAPRMPEGSQVQVGIAGWGTCSVVALVEVDP